MDALTLICVFFRGRSCQSADGRSRPTSSCRSRNDWTENTVLVNCTNSLQCFPPPRHSAPPAPTNPCWTDSDVIGDLDPDDLEEMNGTSEVSVARRGSRLSGSVGSSRGGGGLRYLFANPLSEAARHLDLSGLSKSDRDWRTLTGIRPPTELEERIIDRLVQMERLQVGTGRPTPGG